MSTLSEEDLEVDYDGSLDAKIEAEIELVKNQLRELQPSDEEITFKINYAGYAVMVFGETAEHDLSNELERLEFQQDSETYRLLRKLEDLAYVQENGEFPDEQPKQTLLGKPRAEREKNTTERKI